MPSLFYILFSAFVGGLILNIMPCVLPVITLKLMSFMKLANNKRKDIIKHGVVYSAGVVLSFVALAALILLISYGGGFASWGFQFQSAWFCGGMAAFMILLGLHTMGVGSTLLLKLKMRLKLTKSLGGYVATKLANMSKVLPLCNSFLQGVFTTLIGSACCGPFLGYAIGISFLLAWPITLCVFALIGLGMSFPYLVVSCFPKLMKWIPKPGKWLKWVKYIMGGIMILTSSWFIWILI